MSAAKANASVLPVDDKRRAHEPSIEEILASIRRIISEDQNARPEDLVPEPEEPYEPEPIFEARDSFSGAPSSSQKIIQGDEPAGLHPAEARRDTILRHLKASNEAQSRGAFRQAAEILEAAERDLVSIDSPEADRRGVIGTSPERPETEPLAPLMSATTAASIAAQFQTLAASRLFGDDGRLDELVRELLRPMLREWLDDNLPGIVEKLVRAEIERVARGGRN